MEIQDKEQEYEGTEKQAKAIAGTVNSANSELSIEGKRKNPTFSLLINSSPRSH